MGKQILEDAVNNIKDELMQQLEDAFKEMIEEFVRELIEDVIESIVMMGVGQAITTALAPYVPILAACKAIVGVINDLLDALNLGF